MPEPQTPGDGGGKSVVVGVADLVIAGEPQVRLVTFALASCIGITAHDPVLKIGGMLHFMLPQPAENTDTRAIRDAMYATSGIPLLFRRLREAGCIQGRLVVCAVGGAEVASDASMFAIGKRNRTIMRTIFWQDGITLAAEDTGGAMARAMALELATGEVRVSTRDGERVLWAAGMPTPAPTAARP